jgi:hypothetical protein
MITKYDVKNGDKLVYIGMSYCTIETNTQIFCIGLVTSPTIIKHMIGTTPWWAK